MIGVTIAAIQVYSAMPLSGQLDLRYSHLGRSFLLTGKSFFCLRLVFVAYGQLAWFFYLRLKFGLVFFAYSGKSVWSFLLTVPTGPEIRFGLFCLRFPLSGIGFGLVCLRFPHRK